MERASKSEADVFGELRKLCTSPGYIHVLAHLCFRDNLISYGDALTGDDFGRIFDPERLIRTEISTLLGLLVTDVVSLALPSPQVFQSHIDKTDELLKELHACLSSPMFQGFEQMTRDSSPSDFLSHGDVLRETMFYSGESAYAFQYRDLAPRRYCADDPWMIANMGFTIQQAISVVKAIAALQSDRILSVQRMFAETHPDTWTFLPGFTFKAADLAQASGQDTEIVTKVLTAFAIDKSQRNIGFHSLDDFNTANATPMLQHEDNSFTLFQIYSLSEAIYESPFFWMIRDKLYADTALKHRGAFTEEFAKQCLIRAFGRNHVYRSVTLRKDPKTVVGEIDVLVIFGNRAIVLQAKSKRLTLAARKGNDGVLRDDFKKAIQNSYDQALSCAQLIQDRQITCSDPRGQRIALPELSKIYLICVVSDHYPSLAFQTRQFLETTASERISSPFIMDVFTLDVMAEMLESPLHFLSYIDRRTEYADKIAAGHEVTVLSYHLKQNLWMSGEYDRIMLHDDISTDLDVAMTVRREGLPGDRTPSGILTRFIGTAFDRLIKQIEDEPRPETLGLGFALLKMGGESVSQLNQAIDRVIFLTGQDGLSHDFSMTAGALGVTVHCNRLPASEAKMRLAAHVQMRKYKAKTPRWFGFNVRCPDGRLQFGYNAEFPWVQDDALAVASQSLADYPGIEFINGRPHRKKVGRNDLCPCRSGKKFKKCHGNK